MDFLIQKTLMTTRHLAAVGIQSDRVQSLPIGGNILLPILGQRQHPLKHTKPSKQEQTPNLEG